MEVRLNSPRVKFKITNMADYQVDLAPKEIEVLIRDHSIFLTQNGMIVNPLITTSLLPLKNRLTSWE